LTDKIQKGGNKMEVKRQRKRIISSLLTFVFLFGFLTFNPWNKPSAATNLAAGKTPTTSTPATFINLGRATDGTISTSNYADSATGTGLQWLQIDLGTSYNINDIKLWHYFGDTRSYHDVIVMVSNNASFNSYTIVYSNDKDGTAGFPAGSSSEYTETSAGLDIPLATPVNAQYVRFYTNGNSVNNYNHYGEVQVFEAQTSPGTTNLASKVTPTAQSSAWKNLSRATDGIKTTSNYADSVTATGLQWVQVNLGGVYNISDIKLWHYFGDTRSYHDVIVMVSNNPLFPAGSYTIVYSNDLNGTAGFGNGNKNEYTETSSGLDIPISPAVNAQYVRFYTNGNTVNNYNHVGEFEVYGTAKEMPTVSAWPTASAITYGSKLGDSALSGGAASVPGKFAFTSPATVPNAGNSQTFAAIFTPDDTAKYAAVSGNVTINISKAASNVTAWPTASDISTGMSLGASTLSGGTASVPGTFAFDSPATVPGAGSAQTFPATFTPTDKTNYNTVAGSIKINVVTKALPSISVWPKASDITYGMNLGASALTGGSASVAGTFAFSSPSTVPSAGSNQSFDAVFTPTDTLHYSPVSGKISINVLVSTTTNLALKKPVTSSYAAFKNLAMATDGIKSTSNYADSATGVGLEWVQVDLGMPYDIGSIKLWHYYGDTRTYHDVIVMVSNNKDFEAGTYTIVFNNETNTSSGFGIGKDTEYTETSAGKTITLASAVNAQYVRFYSNGSTANDCNHYGEFEVYAGTVIHAVSLDIAPTSLSIEAGKTATITATVKPDNASNKTVNWSSSDDSVATVSAAGVVTGVKAGTATITATTADSVGLTKTCSVTVTPVKPTGVTLDPTSLTLLEGKTGTLKATVAPLGADQTVNWSSSDPSVATVANGVVTAVKAGTATIKAETPDKTLSATCALTVNPVVHVTSVSVTPGTSTLIEAKLITLKATVLPADATDKSVTWSSSNDKVAKVSSKGVVTGVDPGTADIIATSNETKTVVGKCTLTVTSGKLLDENTIYANDNDNLENIYITITTGNTVTFAQVNAWNNEQTYEKPQINVRFDYGTPATDTTGAVANAVMAQRGASVTTSMLKSYKIELNSGAALWHSQDKILINKSPWDLTKIRNKLAFDLMKLFPNAFSLRDQFCHVYIRDLNSSDKSYKDYGLFTHVEDVGKAYLGYRNIEKDMYMYKAEDFSFKLDPALKLETDPTYSLADFEKVAEVKGIEKHARFLEMLNAVNDETQDINAVVDTYFDRDNYITWLAMNTLLNNEDTTSSNFYLFSPVDQTKWYFIPWDYDESFGYNYPDGWGITVPSWKNDGVEMYAEIVLHRRFLKDPANVAALTAKIEELSAIANKTLITQKVDAFYNVTNALVTKNPDLQLITDPDEIGTTVSAYLPEVTSLKSAVDNAKQAYYNGLQKPMPVLLKEVQQSGSACTFSWDSYSLDGDTIKYHFVLSKNINFSSTVSDQNNLTGSSVTLNLSAGTYYWKVTATDSHGHTQIATSVIYQSDDDDVVGVKQAVIK